ncbi:PAS domain-containing protein [Sphingomonas sp. BK069]|uniref:PAS domain-containing protein n=1 Tax=Sphingomonas sp. BK069 TaxID=2586979 RepID=UPI00182B7C4E|nr:PAS domain-containing protein [Sphingomonas sp. BK069]MBB3347436.1 PAS domain S-box-containing protein [Sphingomonas sp. BK069]
MHGGSSSGASGASGAAAADALAARPARAPDHATEAAILSALAHDLADHPAELLQRLTDQIVTHGMAGSAGVSLREPNGFRWDALSGAWARYRGGGMPLDASPCGVAIARDAALLFERPQELFAGAALDPPVRELLLVPFHRDGRAAGTLWLLAHAPDRAFDREDARLLTSLAQFAASALVLRQRTAELARGRDLLRATMDASTDMIQVFEAVRDERGEIVDFRWLLNNHTSESTYGEVRGQSLLERNPGVIEEGIFATFKHVTETGEPRQDERHYVHEQFDSWFLQTVVKLDDGVATTTKDIGAWKNAQEELLRLRDAAAQDRLRQSEERLRQFGEASHDVLWIRDAATLRWEYLTPAFETVYGLSPDRAIAGDAAQSWLDLVHPEDRPLAEAAMARVRGGEHVSFDYRLHRPVDGATRWIRDTAFPIRDGGAVTLIGGIGEDITEVRQAAEAVRRSEERLRSAVEVGRLGLWDWDVRTGEVHWSDEHFRMQGFAVGEIQPSYEAWRDRLHPEDRAGVEAALRAAMEGHSEYSREFRIVRRDGTVRWHDARGRFFYDADGAIRMVGAMVDVTDRREWEERQAVLIAELQHRTRNLMGVVRSIADNMARTSTDLADFRTRFTDRLDALARVQALLSRLNDVDRVTFDDLLRSELTAMGGIERSTLDGPAGVRLRSSTVQTLAMALHELATNAVKYGALGQPGGQLTVTWRLEPAGPGLRPWLHIDWRERGVAMPAAGGATSGGGQGRELIEQALPYQLGARTALTLERDGAHCTIALPVSAHSAEG